MLANDDVPSFRTYFSVIPRFLIFYLSELVMHITFGMHEMASFAVSVFIFVGFDCILGEINKCNSICHRATEQRLRKCVNK